MSGWREGSTYQSLHLFDKGGGTDEAQAPANLQTHVQEAQHAKGREAGRGRGGRRRRRVGEGGRLVGNG